MTATQLLKSVNNKKHILIDLDTSVETAYYSPREIWIWLSYSQGKSPLFWTKERLWWERLRSEMCIRRLKRCKR